MEHAQIYEFKAVSVDEMLAAEREQDLLRVLKELSELTEIQQTLAEEVENRREEIEQMDVKAYMADANVREAVFYIAEVRCATVYFFRGAL